MQAITAQMVAEWSDPAQEPAMTYDDATAAFHLLGPRTRFLKLLPPGATMLDAGAGDGAVVVFRDWMSPARPDLKMFAWAGIKGGHFDAFDGHEVGYWPEEPPRFGGMQFDAILTSNFIEHIDDPLRFVDWAASRLTARGRIYIEWPAPPSISLPTTHDLAQAGVNVTTGRYDDDHTHRAKLVTFDEVAGAVEARGLNLVERGLASTPYVDQQLAINARKRGDLVAMTLAYWSFTGWCHYLVAEMPGARYAKLGSGFLPQPTVDGGVK